MGLAIARRCAVGAAAALALLGCSRVASANGRYPAAGQIALDPKDPKTLLVRATYGLLLTRDYGERWSWICEGAVGYTSYEDPMLAFASDGTLLGATFEGLAVSHDVGCDFAFFGGGLAGQDIIDLAMQRDDAAKGVLLVTGSAPSATPAALWETSDDGATWKRAGVNLPASFVGVTVDAAPSDPNRVYASGRLGPPDHPMYPGVVERSDDRGASWTPMFIPGSDAENLPYISAIDPLDPDVIYVRIDGNPTDRLVVSKDGGATWTKVFETETPPDMGDTSDLLGFALSPDGGTVALGGPKDGLWTAPAGTLKFEKVSSMSALCLTWANEGLYGCADEIQDGYTAGISKDAGKTWTPLLHLAGLCGPLACGASSSVAKSCTDQWPLMSGAIGDPKCDGASSSAAASSSSGASSGGDSSGAASSGDGCACGFTRANGGLEALAAALLGAGALSRRRRRSAQATIASGSGPRGDGSRQRN